MLPIALNTIQNCLDQNRLTVIVNRWYAFAMATNYCGITK